MILFNSVKGKQILGCLPSYYETSRVMRSMMGTQGTEADALYQAVEDTLREFFVNTAAWGFDTWEQELGLEDNASKSDDQRRSVICSKLRGVGTVTIDLVSSASKACDRGITGGKQRACFYQFTVRFVDTLGAPPNLGDLKATIEEIKPAHLKVVYRYKYLLLNYVHQALTVNEQQEKRMTDFAPFLPLPREGQRIK